MYKEYRTGIGRPKNAGERYSESLTLEQAFARSSNVAAVRLFDRVGDDAVIKIARDYGIRSPLAKGDPEQLGSGDFEYLIAGDDRRLCGRGWQQLSGRTACFSCRGAGLV